MTRFKERPDLSAFLQEQSTAVVSVAVDVDGTIHIATLGFWHSDNPLRFYFVTSKLTEKCTLLRDGSQQKAACVVGTVKGTAFTLQMRGTLQIVDKTTHSSDVAAYTKKRGNDNDLANPNSALLEFVPSWARFTDYAVSWQPQMLDLA